ncbi:hypothetical protein [Sorangium sp. So ce131]|uniref:hypothetical protein n=1 Tax=Sorangium sp. So ce131 TaxID=3133282 RepID=UPI003F5E4888
MIASWDDGLLARGEVVSRLIDLLTPANVAEVVAATPDEWRTELVDHLRAISEAEGPRVWICGGIYRYESEPDPVRRAEMKAEGERCRAAKEAHFDNVIRPAIRAWLRQQG